MTDTKLTNDFDYRGVLTDLFRAMEQPEVGHFEKFVRCPTCLEKRKTVNRRRCMGNDSVPLSCSLFTVLP